MQVELESRMKTLQEIIVKSSATGGACVSTDPSGKTKVHVTVHAHSPALTLKYI